MGTLHHTPATELARQIRCDERSALAVVDSVLDRIHQRNDDLNAYVTVIEERAREAARAVDRGERQGPLAGVPLAVKDLYGFKKGVRQTFGSVPFRDNVADRTAPFIERLEDAGAVVVGMTNTPEFGHKGTTDNQLFGPTKTPFDLDRNAGGSSGGSAAAVADGLATVAHGGDAGGSLRIPASCCGVYAIKPTHRRIPSISRPNGFNSALGYYVHHGPITRTVTDAACMLDVMCGVHPGDPTSIPTSVSYRAVLDRPLDGYSIAYTPDFGTFPVDEQVQSTVTDAVAAFEKAGGTVDTIDFEIGHSHRKLTDTWVRLVEASYAAMADVMAETRGIDLLDDHRADLTPAVARMIEAGKEMSAQEYLGLHRIRTDVYDAVTSVFEEYDLLVSPTIACKPVRNASEGSTLGPATINGEPVDPKIGWCLTHLFNFTGHPAASIPAGSTDDSLPVGMQLVGPRFADDDVLAASAAFERIRPWADAYPPR